MTSIYDIPLNELIERTSIELKKLNEIEPPQWSKSVKTGLSRERPPAREDWWHVRAASVLRKIYRFGPIGVAKLRVEYGGKKNRGHKPEHFYRGSGSIIRKILQQLERAQLIMYVEKGIHKGRIVTSKGKSLLDKISAQIHAETVKEQSREKIARKTEGEAEIKPEAKPQLKKTKDDNTRRTKSPKTKKAEGNRAAAGKRGTGSPASAPPAGSTA